MGIKTRVDVDFSQLNINWQPGTQYRVELQQGFVVEDGGEQQPSPADSDFFVFTTNATGASISSTVPSAGQQLDPNVGLIIFNYNRPITLGSGQLKLYRVGSPDVLVKTYNTTDPEISLGNNGTSVEIDATGDIDTGNNGYYFLVDSSFTLDVDNFGSPVVSNTNTLRFTSPQPPTVISTIPSSGSVLQNTTTVTLNYDRDITLNSGQIHLYKIGSPDTLVHSFNVNDPEITVGENGNSLVIDLVDYISVPQTQYYFLADQFLVRGVVYEDILSQAITNTAFIRYTSETVPVLVSTYPADNTTNLNNIAEITLTFNKNVKVGFGNIKLINTDTGQTRFTFNVQGDRVTASGNIITIDTTFILENGTNYHVTVDNGAILSSTGIPYAGFNNSTTLNFTTAGNAAFNSYRVGTLFTDDEYMTITWPSGTALTATTDNITNYTKGVKLFKNTGGVNFLVKTFYVNKTASSGQSSNINGKEMVISGNTLLIYMSSYLEADQTYYVLIDDGAFYDSNTNLFLPAVTQDNQITFDTLYGVGGLVTEEYIGNQGNQFFLANEYPFIRYVKSLDPTVTYTLEFTSNIGRFSNTGNTEPPNTYIITGNRDALNASIDDVLFFPNKNVTSGGSYTLTLKYSSNTLGSSTASLAYSGTTTDSEIVTFTANSTWTPTWQQLYYRNTADVLLVGGGGAGWVVGAGGGGGGVLEQFNITISNTSYPIVVGQGGNILDLSTIPQTTPPAYVAYSGSGGNTSAFGYTAYGGQGAYGYVYRQEQDNSLVFDGFGAAGDSGAPTSNQGGSELLPDSLGSGGGAGAPGSVGSPYLGGIGIDSTIFGTFGGEKLGAGGGSRDASDLIYQYPRDHGHGGQGGFSQSTRTDTPGAFGVVKIKLKS